MKELKEYEKKDCFKAIRTYVPVFAIRLADKVDGCLKDVKKHGDRLDWDLDEAISAKENYLFDEKLRHDTLCGQIADLEQYVKSLKKSLKKKIAACNVTCVQAAKGIGYEKHLQNVAEADVIQDNLEKARKQLAELEGDALVYKTIPGVQVSKMHHLKKHRNELERLSGLKELLNGMTAKGLDDAKISEIHAELSSRWQQMSLTNTLLKTVKCTANGSFSTDYEWTDPEKERIVQDALEHTNFEEVISGYNPFIIARNPKYVANGQLDFTKIPSGEFSKIFNARVAQNFYYALLAALEKAKEERDSTVEDVVMDAEGETSALSDYRMSNETLATVGVGDSHDHLCCEGDFQFLRNAVAEAEAKKELCVKLATHCIRETAPETGIFAQMREGYCTDRMTAVFDGIFEFAGKCFIAKQKLPEQDLALYIQRVAGGICSQDLPTVRRVVVNLVKYALFKKLYESFSAREDVDGFSKSVMLFCNAMNECETEFSDGCVEQEVIDELIMAI